MTVKEELRRLRATEREYMDYLRAQCESVGADTNVEGLENPKLTLACRYALADSKISLRDRFAMALVTGLADQCGDNCIGYMEQRARVAYQFADAMLKERK